jgi:hypothetical protein
MELDCIYTYLGISDHIGALVILIEGDSGTLATRRTYISIYPSQLAKDEATHLSEAAILRSGKGRVFQGRIIWT